MPYIQYTSSNFPSNLGPNFKGTQDLDFSWDELFHSCVTVGKKGPNHLKRGGKLAIYERLSRLTLLKANLIERNNRIKKSIIYNNSDPSEKRNVSYFIGLSISKLIFEKLFNIGWLMHFDVYKNELNVLRRDKSKSSPDLVGRDRSKRFFVIEAKGRTNFATDVEIEKVLTRGKKQSKKITGILKTKVFMNISLVTHFNESGYLCMEWKDPPGNDDDLFEQIDFTQAYYKDWINIFDQIKKDPNFHQEYAMKGNDKILLFKSGYLDISIGIKNNIYDKFRGQVKTQSTIGEGLLNDLGQSMTENLEQGYLGNDGIYLCVGKTWYEDWLTSD